MASILVVGDERKGGSAEFLADFVAFAKTRFAQVVVVTDRDADLADVDADLVAVFGGDGSILGAARRMGLRQKPTLGINLGRLGFLAAFPAADARLGVEMWLRGELVEETRLMMHVHVERADGTPATKAVPFLNDCVASRDASAGIVTIRAQRPDRELATYSGDGVIVATPVGSTAYSLAAGGPVVSPRLDALVLTPLASHGLTLRPLVVPVGDGVDLLVVEAGGDAPCPLVVDGQVQMALRQGERACLRPAPMRFRHLTRGPASFFAILREKFGWAEVPRPRTRDS